MPAGSYGEALTVAGDHGWLHPCWDASAVADAFAYAADYGPGAIQIEGSVHND